MPKEISHILYADLLRDKISHTLFQESVRSYPRAYYYGAIAPDTFYYDILLPGEKPPSGEEFAEALHGRDGGHSQLPILLFIKAYREKISHPFFSWEEEEKKLLISFFSGILTHMALDITFHPVVYYFAGNYYAENKEEKYRAQAIHRALETVADLYFLSKRRGHTLKTFRASSWWKLSSYEKEKIAHAFTFFLKLAYGVGDLPSKENRELSFEEADKITFSDSLIKKFYRAYRKHRIAHKLFQRVFLGRILHFFTPSFSFQAISMYSSLFYPAKSYKDWIPIRLERIRFYKDPVSGKRISYHEEGRIKRALALGREFIISLVKGVEGEVSLEALKKVFRGYSLNTGYPLSSIHSMKYFYYLPEGGSFRPWKKKAKGFF